MKELIQTIKHLPPPAMFYFWVSMIFFVIMLYQNIHHCASGSNMMSVGSFTCRVPSTILMIILFLAKLAFVTFVIDLIYKSRASVHNWLAWVVAVLPYLSLFLGIFVVGLNRTI